MQIGLEIGSHFAQQGASHKNIQNKRVDLKAFYTLFLEIGLIITLTQFLIATKIDFKPAKEEIKLVEQQENIVVEEIADTKQEVKASFCAQTCRAW